MTVYWIGGSPCAGKTTISNIIGQEFDWCIYSIDRYVETYLQRANEKQHPHLSAYREMGLKKFLLQPPQQQLEQVRGMSREQFSFILEDIAQLRDNGETRPILVEGSNILAEQVASQIDSPQQAFWLVPTEEFQLETYPKRGSWVQDVLRHHYEPDEGVLAFERWMERDAHWAKRTAQQAQSLEFPVIMVDGSTSVLDNAERVMQHFGLIDD